MMVREVVSFISLNFHFTEVLNLMEGEWSCYTLMGGRMVMLKKWCLMEGAWSCYRGGQYNGEGECSLRRWPV